MTGWIIAGLATALCAAIAIGRIALDIERKRHECEEKKIRQEGAENARHTANIITEANKIKDDANTGSHSSDLHTMASQLHDYSH